MCSLIMFIMIRKLTPIVVVAIGVAFFVLWIFFLFLFWKFAIANDDLKSTSKVDDTSGSQQLPEGWLSRSKQADGEDNRLPLTVITGQSLNGIYLTHSLATPPYSNCVYNM